MSANIGEGKYIIAVDNQGAIQQLQKFEQSAKKTGDSTAASFKTSLASAVSLGSGLASLYNQYDNLEKMQLRIRKSSLEVSRAQEAVNKLAQEGKTNTLDYQQAQEKLAIAQERLSQLNGDLKQSQLAVTLSFAQTALSLPAAIAGITAMTAAQGGLMASLKATTTAIWAKTVAMLANPIFAVATAASIAAAVGLVATNTWGLRDALFGTTQSVNTNTDAMKIYNGELSNYDQTAKSASATTRDLNDQMDRTLDKLKKKAIGSELSNLQAEMADSMIFMGSLEQIYNRFKAAGVEGFTKEIMKDTRLANVVSSVLGVDFFDALHQRNFVARGMNNAAARRLSGLSASVSNYFRDIVADARNGVNGLAFTRTLHGNLGFLGGITQAETANLVNGGKTGSTASRSGSSKARSGVGGGRNSNEKFYNNFISAFAPTGVTNRDDKIRIGEQRYASLIEELQSFGLDMPSQFGTMYAGKGNRLLRLSPEDYGQKVNSVMDELKRRKQAKVDAENARIANLVNLSGLSRSEVITMQSTSAGLDDLNGIIDFRKRIALATSGT